MASTLHSPVRHAGANEVTVHAAWRRTWPLLASLPMLLFLLVPLLAMLQRIDLAQLLGNLLNPAVA